MVQPFATAVTANTVVRCKGATRNNGGRGFQLSIKRMEKMKKKGRWSAFYVRRGQVSALPSSGSNEGAAEVAAVASSLSVSSNAQRGRASSESDTDQSLSHGSVPVYSFKRGTAIGQQTDYVGGEL
ncbi:hypothetical protein QTP88_025410 [Uroleucon formosanum]